MKKFLLRAIIFVLVFLFINQIVISKVTEVNQYYNYRINFDLFQQTPSLMEILIKDLADKIHSEKISKYVVLLGNSVMYGSTVPESNSVCANLQKIYEKQNIKVFNLAVPSESFADIYVLLKLMDRYGLSRDNVIFNTVYFDYMCYSRSPFIWFENYLNYLDPDTYKECIDRKFPLKYKDLKGNLDMDANNLLSSNLTMYKLKYVEYEKFKESFDNKPKMYNLNPWMKKPYFLPGMVSKANIWMLSDAAFKLNTSNPSVYFLRKILDFQKGKNTMILYCKYNQFMPLKQIKKIGYINNNKAINKLLSNCQSLYKGLKILDYTEYIPSEYFSDHIHLTPPGNNLLAQMISKKYQIINNK